MTIFIAFMKGMHISAVLFWAAGLLALPILLAQHHREETQEEYTRARRFSHYGYTHVVTPAAVVAVGAGMALIFLREVFVPWMFAKLALVALLAALHVHVGTIVVRMGERSGRSDAPSPILPLGVGAVLLTAILLLVLVKPLIPDTVAPEWLMIPQNRQLPVDEVPT
ncbi:CopD family protein [Pacificimonas flava]|uniref:Protoporphyrinogen IX oxidase n=1 Tax=Pacificimonas flava TaxID=1234595 RepID=M2SBT2_9SPHN|nr:CopD family protein [Pacificimonas flava]EMD82825.1 hypothetical protein C725_1865 [Pacificimonas flava]MBB5279441.1 putative membrane protein [Pacificimonas flava]